MKIYETPYCMRCQDDDASYSEEDHHPQVPLKKWNFKWVTTAW